MTSTPQIDRFSIPPAKRAVRQCMPLPQPQPETLPAVAAMPCPMVLHHEVPREEVSAPLPDYYAEHVRGADRIGVPDYVAGLVAFIAVFAGIIVMVANLIRVIWPW